MITLIHGGPFSASPYDMFLPLRNSLLLQGYHLLIVNYRGSIGYGENYLNELLGHIGKKDVQDCIDLTNTASEVFEEYIDKEKLGVHGGSHGGFLTGHLIGAPASKDMWKAAVLWNAVLDMNYMVASTDIPDWILACTKNEEINFAKLTGENRLLFHERSPISNVDNVKTPSMFLVGDADLRVPPHQSYYFHNALK